MNRPSSPFASFWMGGFECSTHRLRSGRRVDVIDATAHDRLAAQDYAALQSLGLSTVRDGLRWALIERRPGEYDFSSAEAQVQAAQESGVQVAWDLLHYGYPDFLDPYSPEFAPAFAAYARAAGEFLARHTTGPLWVCPVNEISFFAWAGGEVGDFAPFAHGRGHELKRQLAGAAIAAMRALREVLPQVRFLLAEPLITVHRDPQRPQEWADADGFHASQFEALDMLLGRLYPELGGSPDLVDALGMNYYPVNQWVHHPQHGRRRVLEPADPEYRPLHELLAEVHGRYGLPLLLTETGTEGPARAAWLRWVAYEALTARAQGVPVLGVCLYPVVNHPGWADDRHCPNGLLDYPGTADQAGGRAADPSLAAALREVQRWESGELPAQAPPPPSEPLTLGAVLDRLALAAPTILAEAPLRHADGGFPAESFAALRRHGLLRAGLPGGLGYSLRGPELLELLRAVGRLSLPVARLYEGHLNALGLLERYGTARQLAEAAASGAVLGVWNTEEGAGLRAQRTPDGWQLEGNKTFTSGAQFVRPLLPAETEEGRLMLLAPAPLPPERFDHAFWQPLGMRASVSARAELSGLSLPPGSEVGVGGDYYQQPDFSGGALRFLAAQLGGAEAVLAAARGVLARLGRHEDDVQRLRFAEAAAGVEAAWQTVLEGERWLARQGAGALDYVALCRVVAEDACLRACEAAERAVGARGLLAPHDPERLIRDLRHYLRQPAPDAARLQVGAATLAEGFGGWS
ncbi:hypothetical protein Deipr_2087 (plasmid) [Deinococcus proteolyticus MRP]|uniref:Uncharacterized protein n=1 Tax=Deinococcus proteolyticus (strain ATCC 35074 / DSM 20540 / JCM 6276 / NBRC 101906 / NCIMB 13154 / VKM Ac-1939 / CCM 2703 / MRP) TaxID=693977 RepID=F0RQ16_DEIPM|nr:acyl-CoA dehydrogenase family protein [Deinococcus proteolyticus]ADY27218.1 hypothetical protein Deipr_2087 [Deinococcus proteolyticus MRP]